MKNRQTLIFIVIAAVLITVANRMFYVIKPGETGVIFYVIPGQLEKENIRGSGLHMKAPWNKLFRYNINEQQREETVEFLDKDGHAIGLDLTIHFNPISDKVGDLHEVFGTEYVQTLVIPEVRSTVRKVMGRYSAEEIYSSKRTELETSIFQETAVHLKEYNIELHELLIRSINLPPDLDTLLEVGVNQSI